MSAKKARSTEANAIGKVSSRVAGRTLSGSASSTADTPAVAEAADRPNLADLRCRVVKVGDLPEQVESLVDLLPRHILQALGSEAFDRQRTHDATIEHGRTKDRRS